MLVTVGLRLERSVGGNPGRIRPINKQNSAFSPDVQPPEFRVQSPVINIIRQTQVGIEITGLAYVPVCFVYCIGQIARHDEQGDAAAVMLVARRAGSRLRITSSDDEHVEEFV